MWEGFLQKGYSFWRKNAAKTVLAAATAQAQDSRIVLAANIWKKTDQNGDCVVVLVVVGALWEFE